MRWDSERVGAAVGLVPDASLTFSSVSIDTRSIGTGALFVALRGEHFDGHDYLQQAQHAGALGAVVRFGTTPVPGLQFFEVDDPLVALGRLAFARRQTIAGPVVAVTGTNGKTSTKEMVRAVLGTRWATYATVGNRNNLIGVPTTILDAPAGTEALVLEAGSNAIGEIGRLRSIIEPTAAIITNVSIGHIEGFGSEAAVMDEKTSLLEGVELAVTGIVPASLPARAREVVENACSAALAEPAEVTPSSWSVGRDGRVTLSFRGHKVTIGMVGRHQGDNAMLALALGEALGLGAARMAEALATVTEPAGRCTIRSLEDLTVIDDTYNANPGSVLASLDLAESLRGGRRFVIGLGSMLELGDESERWHREVAREVTDRTPDLVVATGLFVDAFGGLDLPPDRLVLVDDAVAMGQALRERLEGNELVLLKASRGVQLDKAIPFLASTEGD